MKHFILLVLCYMGCSLLLTNASAQSYIWHSLSTDDAIQAIHDFEGNPTLAVTVTKMPLSNNGGPASWISYTLTAGRYEYDICAYSLDMFIRDDETFITNESEFYGQTYDPYSLSQQVMSQDAALSIARMFMQAHFPHTELLNMMLVHPEMGRKLNYSDPSFIKDYAFAFYQKDSNGAIGPNFCHISVDSVKGQVVHYAASSFPLLINTTPSMTIEQATASAMNAMNIVDGTPEPRLADGLSVSKPDAFGNESLIYFVTFSGIQLPPGVTDTTGYYREKYVVSIDALTGQVLTSSVLMKIQAKTNVSASPAFEALRIRLAKAHNLAPSLLKFTWVNKETNLNYPLILVETVPYVCAAYLCYGASRAKMTGTGKQVRITGGGRDVSLSMNARTYQVNGQTRTASAKPMLVNGRCYVPLDVVQAVLPGTFRFEPKTRTVRFDPPAPKQAKK